jgi:GH25 family lysozyme M1 (1,4-beta-N-acetylmuramidase)
VSVRGNARYFADLSSNNGSTFDAGAYRRAGHKLIGIKVSQGAEYENPFWRTWATAARAKGLAVLLYHFGDGTVVPAAQAAWFVSQVKGWDRYDHHTDHVCLDLEQASSVADPVAFREAFEPVVHAAGFRALTVYSDAGYFAQYGAGLRPARGGLWVAGFPTAPAGWWTPLMWAHQYSASARVAGISGECDLSVIV